MGLRAALFGCQQSMGCYDSTASASVTRHEKSGQPLPHWSEIKVDTPDPAAFLAWQPPDDPVSFWREKLNANEYKVLRLQGTEPPGSSVYDKFYPRHGYFACRACSMPLYHTESKFDSHTGWPSFGNNVQGSVTTASDWSLGLVGRRTELRCAQCGSHLGHVFSETHNHDGKVYTERQCINGVCLWYVSAPLPMHMNAHATALHPNTGKAVANEVKTR